MSINTLISRVFTGAEQAANSRFGAAQVTARYWITNPYHAVSIVRTPAGACQAVKAMSGRRFLSKDAPELPLAGCGTPACRCVYRHHDDRRSTPRRAADRGEHARAGNGNERRQSPGRRSIDSV